MKKVNKKLLVVTLIIAISCSFTSVNVLGQVNKFNSKVSLKAVSNGKYVQVENNETSGIVAGSDYVLSNETFELYTVGFDSSNNKLIALKASNGKYVSAQSSEQMALFADKDVVGDWEKFVFIISNDGKITLKAFNGKYITVDSNDNQLKANSEVETDLLKFEITYLPIDTFQPSLIGLTYDDGPDIKTLELAQYLHDQKVSATFFVTAANPDGTGYNKYPILKQLVELGHRIANHTYNHAAFSSASVNAVEELKKNQRCIDQYITNELYLFRPPYGDWSEQVANSILSDKYLNKLVGPIIWDFDFLDWNYVSKPPQTCAWDNLNKYQLLQSPLKQGVILNHDRNENASGTDYALQIAKVIIPELKSKGYIFTAPVLRFSPLNIHSYTPPTSFPDYSDLQGWGDDIGYYGTIRLADINGDGKADICARSSDGIECSITSLHPSAGLSSSPWIEFSQKVLRFDLDMSDSVGWKPAEYSTTVQFADVNGDGKMDLCGRGNSGIFCALANSSGTGFENYRRWSFTNENGIVDFFDADGWASDVGYYGTIRFADVNGDGKADVCARSPNGIVCGLSNGNSFEKYTNWLGSDMSDNVGWKPAEYSTTIQFADINGDGKADLCGRGCSGIFCALANSSGTGFEDYRQWSFVNENGIADFSDFDGWASDVGYYGTIRFADVNGDGKADVCARSPNGIVCGLSNGNSFTKYTTWLSDMSDDKGWKPAEYSTTIQFADINGDGRADVCGRGPNGMVCGFAP